MTEAKDVSPKTRVKTKKSAVNLAVSKNSKILALFAIACTVIVGLVSELTQDKINAQQQKQLLYFRVLIYNIYENYAYQPGTTAF